MGTDVVLSPHTCGKRIVVVLRRERVNRLVKWNVPCGLAIQVLVARQLLLKGVNKILVVDALNRNVRLLKVDERTVLVPLVDKTEFCEPQLISTVLNLAHRLHSAVSCVSSGCCGLLPHVFEVSWHTRVLDHGPELVLQRHTNVHKQVHVRETELCLFFCGAKRLSSLAVGTAVSYSEVVGKRFH